ncbi:hypothetical protein [Bifidobacterium tissieri]|uniref:hypothetical protein n=1 Tax=Bifidobacterium tissieri TaxID=1630162 RepID=UPI00123C69AF|nr:hypothetical protein [Bifidobacterium tissieri]KAA8832343.1 hypothetical protein EM849_05240 [Bifidobacterium tissieri]
MPMLLVFLFWIVLVVVLVVAVLRYARQDAHRTDFFYSYDKRNEEHKPRVVSTKVAFQPSGDAKRGASNHESTSETPVYVNHSSVVEVHGMRRADGLDEHDEPEGSDGK